MKQSHVLELFLPPQDNWTELHCFKREVPGRGVTLWLPGLVINLGRGCAGERGWHHSWAWRFCNVFHHRLHMHTRNTR